MSNHVDVPDEAVEAVVRSRRSRHDDCEYEGQYDEAREDLQAAAPAIAAQAVEAERERLEIKVLCGKLKRILDQEDGRG